MGKPTDFFWGCIELTAVLATMLFACVGVWATADWVLGGDPEGTPEELCALYFSEWNALNNCHTGPTCRLTDREYDRWRDTGMAAMQYCGQQQLEAEPDRDVHPPTEKQQWAT